MSSDLSLIPTPKSSLGAGRIVLRSCGSDAVLSEMSSSYPLKLLSPKIYGNNVAVVYILSYGGGLVGGDQTTLAVEVRDQTRLVLLSQGSTKVFKTRPALRLSLPSVEISSAITVQRMEVVVASASALFLLPDPVTCFRSAKYHQLQTFRLEEDASIVILDWITSGRRSLGEDWVFSRYYSLNEVLVGDERVAKDVMLLEEPQIQVQALPHRPLRDRLAPYSCYAMVIMYGPLVRSTIQQLSTRYKEISVFKRSSPPDLLWSLSTIRDGKGCVLRVAALETEAVKVWLSGSLSGLGDVLGADVYRKAFV
ncbi:UreD-domain-containing protein [Obba rivulosa]|uniref:UreD-domain-containing protein n=1 Tax=Obba rivulosa TaxID=1052685 RepID=A0A8E2J6V7_9APHY|nr:UreD-domain-containing protein [Obba rivulosa]